MLLFQATINGKCTHIHSSIYGTVITAFYNGNEYITFSNDKFYTRTNKSYIDLPEYSPDIIQYYDTSEEEAFQYNTIMDYNTQQAIVHLYDYIIAGELDTEEQIKKSIQLCIDNSFNQSYTIVLED